MREKLKKLFKSTAFNIFLIILFSGLVLWLTLRKDGRQILALLTHVKPWMVLFLFGMMVLERFLLGAQLTLECRQTHPKYTYWQGFQNAYTAGLFCDITPGATGGQIAQGYLFKKQGIPLSHAVGVLWLDFIVTHMVMVAIDLFLLLTRFNYFYSNYSSLFGLVLIGFAIGASIITFMWVLALSPRFYTWLTTKGIKIGARLHIVKDEKKTLEDLDHNLEMFAKELVVFRTHKKLIIQLVVLNFARYMILYSVPYFCAIALHIPVSPSDLLNIIALTAFVSLVNYFLPMPGSAGGTEAAFILMFSTIFSKVNASSIMLLWRLMTYYQVILVGTIIFSYARSLPDVPIDEDEENKPRTYAPQAMSEAKN